MRPVVLLLAVALAGIAGAAPRPAACPDGRFPLAAVQPIGRAGGLETLVWDGHTLAVDDVCPPVRARVRATARGTTIRARWASCPGLGGRVKLKARIAAPACDLLRGTITVDRRPRKRRFAVSRRGFDYGVPLDPTSPWPKFRRTAEQTGRSPIRPTTTGGHLWTFPTGKGIFSTPAVGGDGTVYVGSADRTFYALDAATGRPKWQHLTGEIIDSSALLDDRGRVYVGSGDGILYAFDAPTGAPAWQFAADPASATGAFINWFEGNVAIGTDGTLYVPNDNFLTYAIDRDTRAVRWAFRTADQTWSLPALDPTTGRLFMGNNIQLLLPNVFAIDAATGTALWSHGVGGTVAASPMVTRDGKVIVGGYDGFVRCWDQASGVPCWSFGARDHIYASPAELPDGTIVQPSADGSVYGLDPDTGTVRWQFDTRDAIRSSPAVDGDGNVYVGSGEGRLFVLHPDGTLRWSMQLIDGPRDDLNASPALGHDAILIAGESGEVFSVPYDWCLRPEAAGDGRCRTGGEDLPDDGAFLLWATQFGRLLPAPPAAIEANQPLTLALLVRAAGDTILAHVDTASVVVTTEPPAPLRAEVSGDRKFITLIPEGRLAGPAGGPLHVRVHGDYLVNPDRQGLRFTGGSVGGAFAADLTFDVRPAADGGPLPLPVPAAPGDPAGIFELSRLAAPLPTILPSYNQIGFDSLHYLVGLVESTADGQAIAWVVGGRLAEGENRAVVDPATRVLFPLELRHDGGLVTMANDSGFAIEFNNIRIPFALFRIATRLDARGAAETSPTINALTPCAGITFYGPFFQQLGFCNPQTDLLNVFGGAELAPYEGGVQTAPAGVGAVAWSATPTGVTATLTGSALRPDTHAVGILLVDVLTGKAVTLDYGFTTTRSIAPDGTLAAVHLPFPADTVPHDVRAWLMVDAYPAARTTLAVP
ncbi:MAG: PQQ-like beta-propeller repeat protein [bacterium]|nr:PQQ-like beta-propeller repeat protein [bacterium]